MSKKLDPESLAMVLLHEIKGRLTVIERCWRDEKSLPPKFATDCRENRIEFIRYIGILRTKDVIHLNAALSQLDILSREVEVASFEGEW